MTNQLNYILRKANKERKEVEALQIERNAAWHKFNSTKNNEDWKQVQLLDSYIKDYSITL